MVTMTKEATEEIAHGSFEGCDISYFDIRGEIQAVCRELDTDLGVTILPRREIVLRRISNCYGRRLLAVLSETRILQSVEKRSRQC